MVTIELPSAGVLPDESEQEEIWSDLLRWLDRKIEEEAQRRTALSRMTPTAAVDAADWTKVEP